MDWEIKARQLAGELEAVAFALLVVGLVGLWQSNGGWAIGGWALVIWLALAGLSNARI